MICALDCIRCTQSHPERRSHCLLIFSIIIGRDFPLVFIFSLTSLFPISSDYEVECGCDQRACLLEKGVADKGIGKKKLPERGSVTRLSGDTPIHAKKRRRTTSSLNSPVVISQPVQAEEVWSAYGCIREGVHHKGCGVGSEAGVLVYLVYYLCILFRSKERKEMLIVQPRKRCVLCVWMYTYVRD